MDQTKFIRLLLLTTTFSLLLSGCGIFNKNINLAVKPDQYQAFFIALPEKTVTPIEQVLDKDNVVADFWFETQDPEIGTMGDEFEGIPHKGQPTQVALVPDKAYSALKNVPKEVNWKNFIGGVQIQPGMLFLVKASNGKVYKVKLKNFSDDKVKFIYKGLPA